MMHYLGFSCDKSTLSVCEICVFTAIIGARLLRIQLSNAKERTEIWVHSSLQNCIVGLSSFECCYMISIEFRHHRWFSWKINLLTKSLVLCSLVALYWSPLRLTIFPLQKRKNPPQYDAITIFKWCFHYISVGFQYHSKQSSSLWDK